MRFCDLTSAVLKPEAVAVHLEDVNVVGEAIGAGLLFFSGWSAAEVKPGDFINWQNADKVKDIVSPGVYWRVQHGMTFKIVPTERIDWPPPYKDATEKYSSQVRLSDDRRSLVGFVAGQPFPLLDPNDPHVAQKIIWNYYFRPISTDDYDAIQVVREN
jgi:hypothetical protein